MSLDYQLYNPASGEARSEEIQLHIEDMKEEISQLQVLPEETQATNNYMQHLARDMGHTVIAADLSNYMASHRNDMAKFEKSYGDSVHLARKIIQSEYDEVISLMNSSNKNGMTLRVRNYVRNLVDLLDEMDDISSALTHDSKYQGHAGLGVSCWNKTSVRHHP